MNLNEIIIQLLSIPAILIALTVHEYSHGYAAWKLGDPTARSLGRLSLNPLRHLDPIGALMMLFVGFGWAKPVPVNPRYFKYPRKGMALTSLAGPASNIILAVLSAFLSICTYKLSLSMMESLQTNRFVFLFFQYLLLFLQVFHILNLSLAMFNLIPLPPLDGFNILALFLPYRWHRYVLEHERKISLFFMIWLLLGSRVAKTLLGIEAIASSGILRFLVKCLSITGWLGEAVQFISDAIFTLFGLIPFLSI